ncbi:flagellar biosynthesis protein FlhA [bacterium]|nr:flagellar biosynthesis protein FlhA [bacterium]
MLMSGMTKNSDIAMAATVVLILVMMIIPMPAIFVDLLITANIAIAMMVMLVTMYTKNALEFSVFPALLLVLTLFRLSLNVTTTRLILLKGKNFDGQIIKAFGNFVVGGNYVVGIVIFLILVVIQFIVITKGASRVAEVAARFTLDAMPGKQMSIDADLNAGLINNEEARDRRMVISQEAEFYGAMDGASKFVSGDAIAGIVITVINIIGGFIIGMWQHGLSPAESAEVYILFTIGDGLVAQIPALLISTATGLIVTRASTESNLGEDVRDQILKDPKILFILSSFLGLLGIIPGLPMVPFISLAIFFGGLGMILRKERVKAEVVRVEDEKLEEIEEIRRPESVTTLVQVDPVELEIGYSLIPLVDTSQGGDLLDRITVIRRQTALDLGLIVPPIRIRDNMQLTPNSYVLKIKGVEIETAEMYTDMYLAMNPGDATGRLDGIETIEPAFRLKAFWISEREREKAENGGYTVVDPPSVIATHISELIKRHAHEILDREVLKTLTDGLRDNYPTVMGEIDNLKIPMSSILRILKNLLREQVSIRNLATIFETILDSYGMVSDPDILTEYVRQGLGRVICKQLKDENNVLHVVTLSPELEQKISSCLMHTDGGKLLNIPPDVTQKIFFAIHKEMKRAIDMGVQFIVLASAEIRPYFRAMVVQVISDIIVISYNEISTDIEIKTVGMIKI